MKEEDWRRGRNEATQETYEKEEKFVQDKMQESDANEPATPDHGRLSFLLHSKAVCIRIVIRKWFRARCSRVHVHQPAGLQPNPAASAPRMKDTERYLCRLHLGTSCRKPFATMPCHRPTSWPFRPLLSMWPQSK